MHPAWKAVLAAAVLGLLLPTAAGQALDPAVGVEADAQRVPVPAGGEHVVTWTVRNDGPVQATVALDLALDGAWSSDFADRYAGPFALPSGGVRVLSIRVAPTTDTTEALPDEAMTLTATATDAAGRSATATATVALAYGPTPLPPPPPPPDHTLRNSLLGVGAGLLLLGAAHVALGRLVTVRAPVREVPVLEGRSGWVRFEVRNRAPWPQTVRVRLRGDAASVLAATDADAVRVRARDRAAVTLHVRPRTAEPTPVVLEARTRGHRWRRQAAVRVVRPEASPSPFEAPAVARPAPRP